MPIRAVLFDFGGVLAHGGDEQWVRRWGMETGTGPGSFAEVLSRIDTEGGIGTGEFSEDQLREGLRQQLGLTDAQSRELMAQMWEWNCGTLDRELDAFARSLRPRRKVGILSNSQDGSRRERQRRFDFDSGYDPIIYSHETGLAKPDRACYAMACGLLGCPPAEVLLLDDFDPNVAAAKAFGMVGVLHVDRATSIAAIEALLD